MWGGVLTSPGDKSRPDTSFIGAMLEDVLLTPLYEGMVEIMQAIVVRSDGQGWIVSKCGKRIQERTMQWFERHRFFDVRNVRFRRRRPEKTVHCCELGIPHFLDDRADVLDAMAGVFTNRYLFGPQPDPSARDVRHVATWQAVARELL